MNAAEAAGTAPFTCRVCGHAEGPGAAAFARYRVREAMFCLPEQFDYLLCPDCGALQIAAVPEDLGRYYGPGYYSYGPRPLPRGLAALLVRARNRWLSGRPDPLGALLARWRPFLALASLRPLKLARTARILDVGCGSGELLLALQSAGFRHLLGADPYIAQDLDLGGGLKVLRRELQALQGPFDLVMFHHSLEHMPDQAGSLRAAHALLAPGGHCIVRIPTVSSHAWRHYGVDWCALDAPRHLVLHSRASIARLAQRCGFVLRGIDDDSTAFQFWGSEQYRRGRPLMRPGCHDIVPAPGAFTPAELKRHARQARALNRAHEGDQIVVRLQRAPQPA